MPFTLNDWRGSNFYVQAATPGFGGTLNKTGAWAYINADVNLYYYPVAENVYYNYYITYLPAGFPSGTYKHWDTVYGTQVYGTQKYIYIVQSYPRNSNRVPYQVVNWDDGWKAIDKWYGIVW